jgi:hypothetical protein
MFGFGILVTYLDFADSRTIIGLRWLRQEPYQMGKIFLKKCPIIPTKKSQ